MEEALITSDDVRAIVLHEIRRERERALEILRKHVGAIPGFVHVMYGTKIDAALEELRGDR